MRAYIINIQTGSRKKGNFTRTRSIPLSSKEKVRNWIKLNPCGNNNTNITIKDNIKQKTVSMKKGVGTRFGRNIKDLI